MALNLAPLEKELIMIEYGCLGFVRDLELIQDPGIINNIMAASSVELGYHHGSNRSSIIVSYDRIVVPF